MRILAFATQGHGGNDESRLRELLSGLDASFFPFQYASKKKTFRDLLAHIRAHRPELIVMEGTGIAGGLAVLAANRLWGVPFVLSSGDAVGPFVSKAAPLAGPIFSVYERALYRRCAGFIGWTPYLVGRALSFGAPKAMTAPGWAPWPRPDTTAHRQAREAYRAELGIPKDALVLGLVGSLAWNSRIRYAYGMEIVQAVKRAKRPNVHGLIVGGGGGLEELRRQAGELLGKRLWIPGPVTRDRVPAALAAMDLASLPQSVDEVGSFRYTTKLPEYLTLGVPVVMNAIPASYDLPNEAFWRLPGNSPWDPATIKALAQLLDSLDSTELQRKSAHCADALTIFQKDAQIRNVTCFLQELSRE